jgi:hypothetical protein
MWYTLYRTLIYLEKRKGTIITVGSEKNPPQANKEATKAEAAKDPPPLHVPSSEGEARSKEATQGTSQDLPAPPSAEGESAKLSPPTNLLKVPKPVPYWYKKFDQSILEEAEESPQESRKKSDSSPSLSGRQLASTICMYML